MSENPTNQEVCVDCDPSVPSAPANAAAVEDPLNKDTFIAPTTPPKPTVVIEYCDRCRWLHRATWVATELSITFPSPMIRTISLVAAPAPTPAGRFRVWLFEDPKEQETSGSSTLIWDRKVDNGFPELKALKQRIRDRIAPGVSLGHSDK